jgi:hypothetical protein
MISIGEDPTRPDAELFHVDYVKDGADPATRPMTFLLNGGPGVNPLEPFPIFGSSSSSGSAISIAAHFAVVSIRTETAGSLVALSIQAL